MQIHGRYYVQKALRASVLSAFSAFGLDGWECIEYAQTAIRNSDKAVMLEFVSSRQCGFQGFDYVRKPNGEVVRMDDWLDEQTWRIHVIAKVPSNRGEADGAAVTDDTLLAEDVARHMVAWFNGPGAVALRRAVGFGTLRVKSDDVKVYKDESDLNQKYASLDCVFQVPQTIETKETGVSGFHSGIYPE